MSAHTRTPPTLRSVRLRFAAAMVIATVLMVVGLAALNAVL
jgi:hypothetical protein